MKKQILTAIAVLGCLYGYAQTKGTSALGFGISSQTNKYKFNDSSSPSGVGTGESKFNSYSLGYGLFVKDNVKIGVDLNYGTQDNNYLEGVSGSKSKNYGGNVSYQYYFPLVKTLYAYAGGQVGYGYGKSDSADHTTADRISNNYSAGVYGGLTWFVSRHFALETSLLGAGASYLVDKEKGGSSNSVAGDYKQTTFNLRTNGTINTLGFKIYLLF